MLVKSCLRLILLVTAFSCAFGGYPGVVDDEIWHHVLSVLSHEHGGSKILLDHPKPAHLVDAYTKIEYHEPYHHDYGHHHGGYHDGGYHHSPSHHGHHHHHHAHAPVYKYKAPVVHSSYGPPYQHDHHHHHLGHYKK